MTPPYEKEEPAIQENPISRSSGDSAETPPENEVSSTGNPGRVVSDEERDGMGDTDMAPEPALGVGEHLTTAGEDRSGQDAGEEGRKGESGRPHGKEPDESGISQQPDETDSPVAGEPGDQGG
ncbi:hypothetical protein [Pseudonocardia nigra]|uniref:hypothetical protein n=1 Tax=Pseudonocardia nigra TaxID=1921578 RepID=UPI001C5CF6C9|nr:hypothetical protein [Pseudonocardia nigra]